MSAAPAPTFEIVRGSLPAPLVLSCEHAHGRIPPELDDLGLTPAQLEACAHGVDLGAAELFRFLVEGLDGFGIVNRVSRLVIDLNRYEDQSDLIPTQCGGCPIPANLDLDDRARQWRIERYHRPYQRALHALLEECERRHDTAFLLRVHTMAAVHEGEVRRQDFVIVGNRGLHWGEGLARALAERGRTVTLNQPFHLERDLVRVAAGSPLERFNDTAVLVEMNDRHRGDAAVHAELLSAIRTMLAAAAA